MGPSAEHRPRVLTLTSTLPRWQGDSTPRFVLDLAVGLSHMGWNIEALAPGYPGAGSLDRLDGIDVQRFSYAWPPAMQTLCYDGGMMPNLRARPARAALVPGFVASAVLATRRSVMRFRPDLVHAHWIVPMGLVAALAIPRNIPLVLSVHGSDALALGGRFMDGVKRRVLRRADAITCNGSRTEAAIQSLVEQPNKVARIPMGADGPEANAEHGLVLPRDRFKLAFAGRLFRGKGLDDLLDALAGFEHEQRPLLFVAGTGPEADRFAGRAATLGIERDVVFLGGTKHSQLLALFRDVDAVIVPTRNRELIEAQGLVIAEAMFAGTPVVATTGGGAEDHVQDGRTGLLVSPADPTALHNAIAGLMRDPRRAKALSAAAAIYARDHLSWQASALAFAAVFRQVLGAAKRV